MWESETPPDEAIGNETVEVVQNKIEQLKPDYREVIFLREYEQMSYAEIALVTGDTESAAKTQSFKARKALVKNLEPYFREQS